VTPFTTGVTEGVVHSFNAIHRLKMSFTVDISQRWAEIGGEVGGLKPKMKSVPGKYKLVARPGQGPGLYPGLVLLYSHAASKWPWSQNKVLFLFFLADLLRCVYHTLPQ
jgi:hypothetical protein